MVAGIQQLGRAAAEIVALSIPRLAPGQRTARATEWTRSTEAPPTVKTRNNERRTTHEARRTKHEEHDTYKPVFQLSCASVRRRPATTPLSHRRGCEAVVAVVAGIPVHARFRGVNDVDHFPACDIMEMEAVPVVVT